MSVEVATRPSGGIQPIMGTNVPCFTVYANPSRDESVDMSIVYIAKIAGEGREITLKPLCIQNSESLSKAKFIASNALIVGLKKTEDGIHLILNESKAGAMKPETKLFLECQGDRVELGTLYSYSSLKPADYKELYLDKAYMVFIKTMQAAIQRAASSGHNK